MMETYNKVWWTKVEENKQNDSVTGFWQNYELGFFYLLMLVCGHLLTKGKTESILK